MNQWSDCLSKGHIKKQTKPTVAILQTLFEEAEPKKPRSWKTTISGQIRNSGL